MPKLENPNQTPEDEASVNIDTNIALYAVLGAMLMYPNLSSATVCSNIIKVALRVIGIVFGGLGELWRAAIGFVMKTALDKVIEYIIEYLKDAFFSLFDSVSKSMGKTGDAVNTNTKTIHDESLKRDLEIPADYCAADEVANKIYSTHFDAIKEAKNRRSDTFENILRGHLPWNELSKEQTHWRVNPAIKENTNVKTDAEKAALKAFDETTLGDLTDELTKPHPRNETIETNMIARKARVTLLQSILDRMSTRNVAVGDNEYSAQQIIDIEIQRTYGDDGQGWREIIAGMSSPVPLIKERCFVTAFNNHLKTHKLRQEEDLLVAKSIEILELLETPELKEKIYARKQSA